MSNLIFGKALEFDEKKHAYKYDGNFVPGVTSILSCIGKPALIPWAAGMASDHWLKEVKSWGDQIPTAERVTAIHKEAKSAHRKKAQDAADIGHNVHEYAEMYFKKKDVPALLTDQAKRGVEAFHKWLDAHHVEIISSERRVFSLQYYFAGTCDLVAKVDGVMVVGDIKTSSGIYPEMRLQTAAYQRAIEEEDGTKFPERLIIRFDKKDGNFEAKTFKNFDLDFAGFLAALNLYRSLQSINQEEKDA